jgi:hypothetical protein
MTPCLMMAAAMRYRRPDRLWRFVRTDDGLIGPGYFRQLRLSQGRLHPFRCEGSVPQADAGQLHDRI